MINEIPRSPSIASSREAILREIGDPPDLTFVRGVGNRGDELIWAGTRELLSERIYREIDLEALCGAHGHTVLLSGGGAFCRNYHELMPRALAVAEMRFERVIVLPSSFDTSEDTVREALARTGATVFARERESYLQIRSLCDARLAHDCAFFFDFGAHRRDGSGTLSAFRTDHEALGSHPRPAGNDDISVTAPTLESWLGRIAEHELVRTDRGHVMIAAALLGKRVEFAPNSYHKVTAIADYALSGYPVVERALGNSASRAAVAEASRPSSTSRRAIRPSRMRVAAVVLSRDRPDQALRAVDSLQPNEVGLETLVIDNNSAPAAAALLATGCAERDGVRIHRSDRNLRCAGGRRFGVEETEAELVLFLDDDAELEPGALDRLVADLDDHPEAAGVTATVAFPDGTVQHSGGWMRISRSLAEFGLVGAGQPADSLPPSGPVDWVPGTAALIRRSVLRDVPIDEGMRAYYEDNEWCYRVECARPGSFLRSIEARALHRHTGKRYATAVQLRSAAVERLEACAWFYARHGKLLNVDLFAQIPELSGGEGKGDLAAARLLMELVLARGPDWVFMEWINGGMDVLLSSGRRLDEAAAQATELGRSLAEERQHVAQCEHHVAQYEQRVARYEQRLAELQETLGHQRDVLGFLQARHETLVRVEQGGWWRTRDRLLPALRLYWRLRGR